MTTLDYASSTQPYEPHILVVPYPSQGHVNPTLQFCKRLATKGAAPTLALTEFISATFNPNPAALGVAVAAISDGFDRGGFGQSQGVEDYLTQLRIEGSRSLGRLIESYRDSGRPVDCVVYDSFLTWALDVAEKYGVKGGPFFTQACMVDLVYYYVHEGVLKIPVRTPPAVELAGLPPLEVADMPSFIYVHGSYPAYFEMVSRQFENVGRADFVLINTFYELEAEAVDSLSKVCPILTIGPTIPSFYLDNQVENDDKYNINLFDPHSSSAIADWLNTKSPGSVVYVAFGSMTNLPRAQLDEIAWGLANAGFDFLWVVTATDFLPEGFVSGVHGRSLVVQWCSQLEVLSHKAVGCFFSHGGWNSTIEALSLGMPMVVFPQWTDQTMDAKLIQDVWRVGVRVRVGPDGIVRKDEIEGCIREVMEGEKGKELKTNASRWRDLAMQAVCEGGTSYANVEAFISKVSTKSSSFN